VSQLFSSFALRKLTLPNRIVVSPMCQYVAVDGKATHWHLIHWGTFAQSGAGMLCIEATSVEAKGRITPGDLGLYDDATEEAVRVALSAVREHSKVAITMQLAHAGRKASCRVPWEGGKQIPRAEGGWTTCAPSAIAYNTAEDRPAALDAAGLDRVRQAFIETARRAQRLGIDGLEIHGAHGYLLHQFMSPLSNHRTDQYGGSLANRLRFPLEVFDAVRAEFPQDKPVGFRVSATDWVDGGWDLTQTLELARQLKQRGADWIDVSSGGLSPAQKIPLSPGYQVPFANAVKDATGLNTIAVGLITNARQAEDVLASGNADLVALARGLLYDPRWPWHAAAELGGKVNDAPSYLRAPPHEFVGIFNQTR
jgi:2,4-dienoyl-CoA reductase-like NADH-dependent reductase (Old Yellow Enzyme family)